ncbi:MAG: Coq4 family protein [Nannocystaceae bacterium]
MAMREDPSSTDLPTSLVDRVRVGLRALWRLKDDQGNPEEARLLHLSFDSDTYARLADELRRTAAGRELLAQRRTIPGEGYDLEALARLPEGTLGHEFARYFAKNGIEPFTYDYPLRSDGEFLYKRYRETHDVHHIITGYGIDERGEVELQAFYLGNLGLRHAGLIAATAIPVWLKTSGLRGAWDIIRRIRVAYRRGQRSHDLLSLDVDALWAEPVATIAARTCAEA